MHFVDAKGILTGGKGHYGMNIYRGCSHGCIYCDSRSKCYQFTHAFEDIEVKQNAPELLEQALKSKRQKAMIGTGSMSDPYMHCEEQLGLTRKCLEVISRYGFGAAVQTKSDRILRDIDLLEEINRKAKCVVQITLTTYDEKLCGILEPNVCKTRRRIEVLEAMRERDIPTVVWMTPILPFINDTEENVRAILEACAHFPGLKEKYIRTYGNAYEVPSPNRGPLMRLFRTFCREHGILYKPEECFEYMSTLPDRFQQMTFLEGL